MVFKKMSLSLYPLLLIACFFQDGTPVAPSEECPPNAPGGVHTWKSLPDDTWTVIQTKIKRASGKAVTPSPIQKQILNSYMKKDVTYTLRSNTKNCYTNGPPYFPVLSPESIHIDVSEVSFKDPDVVLKYAITFTQATLQEDTASTLCQFLDFFFAFTQLGGDTPGDDEDVASGEERAEKEESGSSPSPFLQEDQAFVPCSSSNPNLQFVPGSLGISGSGSATVVVEVLPYYAIPKQSSLGVIPRSLVEIKADVYKAELDADVILEEEEVKRYNEDVYGQLGAPTSEEGIVVSQRSSRSADTEVNVREAGVEHTTKASSGANWIGWLVLVLITLMILIVSFFCVFFYRKEKNGGGDANNPVNNGDANNTVNKESLREEREEHLEGRGRILDPQPGLVARVTSYARNKVRGYARTALSGSFDQDAQKNVKVARGLDQSATRSLDEKSSSGISTESPSIDLTDLKNFSGTWYTPDGELICAIDGGKGVYTEYFSRNPAEKDPSKETSAGKPSRRVSGRFPLQRIKTDPEWFFTVLPDYGGVAVRLCEPVGAFLQCCAQLRSNQWTNCRMYCRAWYVADSGSDSGSGDSSHSAIWKGPFSCTEMKKYVGEVPTGDIENLHIRLGGATEIRANTGEPESLAHVSDNSHWSSSSGSAINAEENTRSFKLSEVFPSKQMIFDHSEIRKKQASQRPNMQANPISPIGNFVSAAQNTNMVLENLKIASRNPGDSSELEEEDSTEED